MLVCFAPIYLGMIKLNRIRIDRNKLPLPNNCIVCNDECQNQNKVSIKYKPKDKANNYFSDFTLDAPVCREHFEMYMKGKKMAKLSLILMAASLVPFIISIILMAFYDIQSIPLFVIALIMGITSYILMGPSNKKLGEGGKSFILIELVTKDELILSIKNEDYGKNLRALEPKGGWRERLKSK